MTSQFAVATAAGGIFFSAPTFCSSSNEPLRQRISPLSFNNAANKLLPCWNGSVPSSPGRAVSCVNQSPLSQRPALVVPIIAGGVLDQVLSSKSWLRFKRHLLSALERPFDTIAASCLSCDFVAASIRSTMNVLPNIDRVNVIKITIRLEPKTEDMMIERFTSLPNRRTNTLVHGQF